MGYREKLRQQEKFLLQLEKEIKDLKFKIKYSKINNLKIAGIRNLKIFGHIGVVLMLPMVVSAGISVSLGKILGEGLPFVIDEFEQTENIVKKIDSDNNVTVEKHYVDLKQINQVAIYEKWYKNNDNSYERKVTRYTFDQYNEDEIKSIVDGNINNINKILGEPYNYVETKSNLNEEALKQNDPYIQAILYSVNDNTVIVKKETIDDNSELTSAELLITLYLTLFSSMGTCIGYSPIKKIKKTIDDNKKEDTIILKKQLQIREANYNKIVGE